MANLIALQNQLKGLRDEDIDRELNQPSGAVPTFLVASEKQRRDQMRQAYEGEKARQEAGETTVLEDLMNARGMGGQPGPAGMGGPPAPMPAAGGPPMPMGEPVSSGIGGAVPGFANGGLIDYASISTGYGGLQDELARNREMNKQLALAQIGFGIAGGTSPHFATNVGAGAQEGLQAYQDTMQGSTRDQLALLQAQLGLLQTQDRMGLAQQQFTFEQEQAARDALMDERRIAIQERAADRGPAAVQTFEYFKGLTPEEQAEFTRVQQATGRGQSGRDFNTASTAYRRSVEFAEDKVANEPKFAALRFGGEVDPALQAEYNARVQQEAQRRFIDFYPQFQEYLPMFGRGSQITPAGGPAAAAGSGIEFVNQLPEGASVRDLTSPIMRGEPRQKGPPITVPAPEDFIYAR